MSEAPNHSRHDERILPRLLREHREERGLSLSEVAQLTHVRKEYLAALEEGRYDELPEDVYARNFLRLYAGAVGLDTVRALELFRSERHARPYTAPPEEPPAVEGGSEPPAAKGREGRNERRERAERQLPAWWAGGRTLRLGALTSTLLMVGAVVALALWGFNSTFFNPSRGATTSSTNTPQARAGAEDPVTEPEEESSAIPRTVRLSVASDPAGAEVSVDEFPLPGTTPIESAPVTARPSRTVRVSLEGYEPIVEEVDLTGDRELNFTLTPQVAATDDEDEEAAEADGQEQAGAGEESGVTLTITEDSWLEVYSGTARNSGQRLAFLTARAGQTFNFPLPVYVHVGNAGGVELTVNGQDRGSLGSSGEVRGLAISQ